MNILYIGRKYVPDFLKMPYKKLRSNILSFGLARNIEYVMDQKEVEASERISIVVAIYNARDILIRCLNSIEKYSGNAEVILVDDNSTDNGIIDIIDSYVKRNNWKVLYQTKQKGHSRTCEAGASMATKDIICFLNSDTVVTHRSWYGIVKVFDEFPNIAVAGPSTSWAGSVQCVIRAMHCRFYWDDRLICSFAEKYTNDFIKKNNYLEIVSYVTGFAFFVRRNLWELLGSFSLDLPDYGNEIEFCNRVIKLGYQIMWVRSSYIHHFGKMSYGPNYL